MRTALVRGATVSWLVWALLIHGVAPVALAWAGGGGGFDVDQRFVSGAGSPEGVAVDGRYVFWANSRTDTIGRANLDGSGVVENLISGASYPPSVAVDGRYVYWVNSGRSGAPSGGTIGRATLDGAGAVESFITGLTSPEGIAVGGGRIYWTSAGTIGSANLDGSNVVHDLVTGVGAETLAIGAGRIYWTSGGTIGSANLDGSQIDRNLIGGASDAKGVAAADGRIYWANLNDGTIGRANLDGSDVVQTFISGASDPIGVAVTGGTIYWANSHSGTIGRARVNTTPSSTAPPAAARTATPSITTTSSSVPPVPTARRTPGTMYYWSETYAEQIVLENVRVPCLHVFGPGGASWGSSPPCDLGNAERDVAAAERAVTQAAHNPSDCGLIGSVSQGACAAIAESQLHDAQKSVDIIRDGVSLTQATCHGTGLPDSSSYRFSTFTCEISLVAGNPQSNVSGRIAVWTTGPTTLRWKLV